MRPEDYETLLRFRTALRHFLRWSEDQARQAGLTPAQHQLLLAVRGHQDSAGPTIGEIAEYLVLRHHSAVELVDRAQRAGLVTRCPDAKDHRVVRIQLTPTANSRIRQLSRLHVEELQRLAPLLPELRDLGHSRYEIARTPSAHGIATPTRWPSTRPDGSST